MKIQLVLNRVKMRLQGMIWVALINIEGGPTRLMRLVCWGRSLRVWIQGRSVQTALMMESDKKNSTKKVATL